LGTSVSFVRQDLVSWFSNAAFRPPTISCP
jgi:hypothetical protein